MMTYKVEWAENKKDDWKVCTLKEVIEGGETFESVSINKVDKKGRAFPNFDGIMPGAMVAGNIWRSPAGKYTLFAPDPPKAPGVPPSPGGRGVAAAQERKSTMIKEAQESKGQGIMVSAAFRDATQIVVNHPEYSTMSFEEAKAFHKRVRDWYIAEWKATEKSLDIPFK